MQVAKDSKPLAVKFAGALAEGETPSLIGEFLGEAHRVLKCTQSHPPGNKHLKGHNMHVESERSERNWDES